MIMNEELEKLIFQYNDDSVLLSDKLAEKAYKLGIRYACREVKLEEDMPMKMTFGQCSSDKNGGYNTAVADLNDKLAQLEEEAKE